MYYVFWNNYDGHYIEECADKDATERFITEKAILGLHKNNYGEHVICVIEGKRMKLKVEQAPIIRIKE